MKTIVLPISLFVAILCCISCQKIDKQIDNAEYYTVRLGISDDVQTKAATNNLYGINVYYDPSRDGNSTAHYAYGLFDNKEDMTITLLSGYTYAFKCTLVKDAKDVLYCGQYGGNTFTGYAKPFQTDNSPSTMLSNTFVYGTTYLSGIKSGLATIKSTSSGYEEQTMASVQRYYGEISSYVPVSGGTVVIPLKKTVFGARMIVDKVPEGRLSASCVINSNSFTLLSGNATSTIYDSGGRIFSYPDVYDCWTNEPQITATVNWTFTSSVFNQWNKSGTKTVTFKRNTLTTITISYTPDKAGGTIGIHEEEMGLADNNINLYINSDGLIDIYVDPVEGDD